MPQVEAKTLFVSNPQVLPTTSIIIHPPETLSNITTTPVIPDPLSLVCALPSTSSSTDDLTTPVPSPPNISNLLGMSSDSDNNFLPSNMKTNFSSQYNILYTIYLNNISFILLVIIDYKYILPFVLGMDETANVTPPTSPSRILKETENDNQWLNAEVKFIFFQNAYLYCLLEIFIDFFYYYFI